MAHGEPGSHPDGPARWWADAGDGAVGTRADIRATYPRHASAPGGTLDDPLPGPCPPPRLGTVGGHPADGRGLRERGRAAQGDERALRLARTNPRGTRVPGGGPVLTQAQAQTALIADTDLGAPGPRPRARRPGATASSRRRPPTPTAGVSSTRSTPTNSSAPPPPPRRRSASTTPTTRPNSTTRWPRSSPPTWTAPWPG
ncbi:hypothetical protein ACRAWF_29710 [Streptomyces sp. L7]